MPGNVLAMVLLYLLLEGKVIKLGHVEEAADFLLVNMAFLFVPATVSIFCNYETFIAIIGKLMLVCLITTILTSLSAGFTVKYVLKFTKERKGGKA